MGTGLLTIDLDALVANWRALSKLSGSAEAGAVVKANGYGADSGRVSAALAQNGATKFFVATAEEGRRVRRAVGPEATIYVFSGHMEGDQPAILKQGLVPMLNSLDQVTRHFEAMPGHPFGIQLDTGMNRLGMELAEWKAVASTVLERAPQLVMSHLACADEPEHPMNGYQLNLFKTMTDGIDVPRSLSATGGILLGKDYHFDVTRPGIGIYGGRPFTDAKPVVQLDLPVIQTRPLIKGEVAGYGNTWQAKRDSIIATVSGGYADGILRAISNKATLWAGDTPCPIVGRVSMDLITVDVTDLAEVPKALSLLNAKQTVDDIADIAGTIGYEILTSLGSRYKLQYQAS